MAVALRRVDDERTVTDPAAGPRPSRTVIRRAVPRLVGALVVLWGAVTISFLVLQLVPGDPVTIMLGAQSQASDETRDRIRTDLGLDRPPLEQYFSYLGRVVTFDLGTSYRLQRPVADVIGSQLEPTLQLTGVALIIACFLALVIALTARGRISRAVASTLELIAISSPGFWTGMLLLTVFSFQLQWFPVSGGQGIGALILPALTLALPIAGILSQLLRQGLDAAGEQPFVVSVLARGVGPARLITHHTLRHAALPTTTFAAFIAGSLLGGTVIIEQLFGRPGIGRVTLDAVLNRDLPVVMAMVIFAAVVFVVVNLLTDALYPVLDPRLRSSR